MNSDALACEGRDDLFFPDDDNYDTPHTSTAKAFCFPCPIQTDCLLRGMKEDWGIWGGMTPDERKRLQL